MYSIGKIDKRKTNNTWQFAETINVPRAVKRIKCLKFQF